MSAQTHRLTQSEISEIAPYGSQNIMRLVIKSINCKRGDIVIIDNNKYICDGRQLELLNKTIPAKFEVITEFPIRYWRNWSDQVNFNLSQNEFQFTRLDVQYVNHDALTGYLVLPFIYNNEPFSIVGIQPRGLIEIESFVTAINSAHQFKIVTGTGQTPQDKVQAELEKLISLDPDSVLYY